MASGLFDTGRASFLKGDLHWYTSTAEDWRCALIDTAVVAPNLATHDFYDDLSSAVVGTPVSFTSSTLTGVAGAADGEDIVFTSVTGAHVEGVIIYKWTGTAGTSNLACWVEFTAVTPNGGNITIQWQATSPYIFKL
jgi:hypothetical protein